MRNINAKEFYFWITAITSYILVLTGAPYESDIASFLLVVGAFLIVLGALYKLINGIKQDSEEKTYTE